MGHFVKNGIFQFFWFSKKPAQNFQKISIPSNSLVNFLHLLLSDHLSISKLKTSKLPLKSGTPLWPLHFGHFWQFFRGFFHLLENPLEIARKFKFHQIPWTITHFFCLFDHVSSSKFSCPKMPSKSGTLRSFTHCGQSILYSTNSGHFLWPEIIIFEIQQAPQPPSVPYGMHLPIANTKLVPN